MAENDKKLTFWSKNEIVCPICDCKFKREELLTGRGRLIAGNLTGELRRLYEPSQKYGDVCPLIYPVTVCPSCYYAAFPSDFESIPFQAISKIDKSNLERHGSIGKIFTNLDFSSPRGLSEGAASYYLAISCYEHFTAEHTPTIKRAISALRAAWIFN
ncbi:MAG: DUF2225 domain-containing protein, partial [Spirochaetales bacterium]|nr:DUF2225 domain-containing protein [Spirochaetales bacterium]